MAETKNLLVESSYPQESPCQRVFSSLEWYFRDIYTRGIKHLPKLGTKPSPWLQQMTLRRCWKRRRELCERKPSDKSLVKFLPSGKCTSRIEAKWLRTNQREPHKPGLFQRVRDEQTAYLFLRNLDYNQFFQGSANYCTTNASRIPGFPGTDSGSGWTKQSSR